MAKDRVLLDTCIIIEAFRVNCWKALCARYDVETVEKCVEEACTGDPLNPKRVPVDRKLLLADSPGFIRSQTWSGRRSPSTMLAFRGWTMVNSICLRGYTQISLSRSPYSFRRPTKRP